MKAVNLIPPDAGKVGRFGAAAVLGGPAGGIGAYVVLAVLAIVAVAGIANAFSNRQLSDKRAQLALVEREAQSAEAKAASLASQTQATELRRARTATIQGLLKGRFDWSHSLREVARVVPSNVSLTSLVGTVTPDSAVAGAGGGTLRSALAVPAIDIIGCAKSHTHVSKLLARLRGIDGVQRVSLASSEKSETGAASDADCRGTDQMPQFQLTVFYEAPEGLVPAVDAATPAPAGSAPPSSVGDSAPAGGAG